MYVVYIISKFDYVVGPVHSMTHQSFLQVLLLKFIFLILVCYT